MKTKIYSRKEIFTLICFPVLHYCSLFIEPREKECTWHFLVGYVDLNNYVDTNLVSIHNLPRGWGHSFSLLCLRGGRGKFPTKMTSNIGGGGGNHFFPEKEKEMFPASRGSFPGVR